MIAPLRNHQLPHREAVAVGAAHGGIPELRSMSSPDGVGLTVSVAEALVRSHRFVTTTRLAPFVDGRRSALDELVAPPMFTPSRRIGS